MDWALGALPTAGAHNFLDLGLVGTFSHPMASKASGA